MPADHAPLHLLTVNLEDYFQVGAFNNYIQQNRWQRFESRIEASTDATLELLAQHNTKATFFVLGWLAQEFPHTIRKVAEAGHEVAVRGFYHRHIQEMTPEEFATDALRARDAVESASGQRAWGYRLADGWLGPQDLWALDTLAELGFAYDSSIAPMRRPFAVDPLRHTPHQHRDGTRQITELPISCGKICGFRVPIASGNYLRQLPRFLTRRATARWLSKETAPLLAYFHTWELDPAQPRLTAGSRLTQMRHYRNLAKMPARLAELLASARFGTCREYLQLPSEPAPRKHDSSTIPLSIARTAAISQGPLVPISIVVPVFNEELLIPNLFNTLEEVRSKLGTVYDIEFVIVDDGSTDRTWERLNTTFHGRVGYQILRHSINEGVSAAIMTGIKGAHTEIVCSMDCDCSYDPLTFAEMIPLLTPDVDLVTASPYHPAGAVKNVPAWRLALSRGAAWMYRQVLKTRLATYTSCFRVYRRSIVAGVQLTHSRFLGVAELLGRLDLMNRKIVEFPAVLEVRMIGRSKMKTVRTIFGHLGLLVRLVLARVRQKWAPVDRDAVIRGQIGLLGKAANPATSETTPYSPSSQPTPTELAPPPRRQVASPNSK